MESQSFAPRLRAIYESLYRRYGPQHWWPAEEPFEVIVGAILTQSTSWTNVEKAVTRLRESGVLTAPGLRALAECELAQLIHSCGYFNVKARRLLSFVRWLGDRHGDSLDSLFSGVTLEIRRELLAVHGIGEETADSILLYAGEKPVFVIDAYTRRICERLGIDPRGTTYADYQRLFMDCLPADVPLYSEYHALIVRLGKEVCRKHPLCHQCPLNASGTAGVDAAPGRFPCTDR